MKKRADELVAGDVVKVGTETMVVTRLTPTVEIRVDGWTKHALADEMVEVSEPSEGDRYRSALANLKRVYRDWSPTMADIWAALDFNLAEQNLPKIGDQS